MELGEKEARREGGGREASQGAVTWSGRGQWSLHFGNGIGELGAGLRHGLKVGVGCFTDGLCIWKRDR